LRSSHDALQLMPHGSGSDKQIFGAKRQVPGRESIVLGSIIACCNIIREKRGEAARYADESGREP